MNMDLPKEKKKTITTITTIALSILLTRSIISAFPATTILIASASHGSPHGSGGGSGSGELSGGSGGGGGSGVGGGGFGRGFGGEFVNGGSGDGFGSGFPEGAEDAGGFGNGDLHCGGGIGPTGIGGSSC